MEQTLIIGLLLSLMGGLGWLSCHYPQFAVKVIIVLLASTLLLHFCIKVYQRGWDDNHTLIQHSVANVMLTLDTLKIKCAEKIKSSLTKAISAPRIKIYSFHNSPDKILPLLEAALAGLLLFALAFQKYIKKLPA
jgi:hypothetical protein